jgi:hypothetical protein
MRELNFNPVTSLKLLTGIIHVGYTFSSFDYALVSKLAICVV